jgi:hypothetical protein
MTFRENSGLIWAAKKNSFTTTIVCNNTVRKEFVSFSFSHHIFAA